LKKGNVSDGTRKTITSRLNGGVIIGSRRQRCQSTRDERETLALEADTHSRSLP